MLLSGDIHAFGVESTPCAAVGGYNMLEYVCSGLSHVTDDDWPVTNIVKLNKSMHPIYSAEPFKSAYNFGRIEIDTKTNIVSLSIQDSDGTRDLRQ